jgi:hypothetical protein
MSGGVKKMSLPRSRLGQLEFILFIVLIETTSVVKLTVNPVVNHMSLMN